MLITDYSFQKDELSHMIHKQILDTILKNALDLNKYGLNEMGWSKQEAVDLIQNLMDEEIGILGGDVYILKDHFLEALSDNWYCELLEGECREHYYKRSKECALKYIKNFLVLKEEICIFSLIFTEKPC